MRQAVLLGSPGTKRAIYLEKGAEAAGISIRLLDWKEFPFCGGDSQESLVRSTDSLESLVRSGASQESLVRGAASQESLVRRWAGCENVFLNEAAWDDVFLKIDPPLWESCCLDELNILAQDYEKKLQWLTELGKKRQITFLNRPEDIRALLDKRACKRRLAEAGIPVTEELDDVGRAELLLDAMERRRIFQVFIKPVCGSGAAGAAAFRWQPRSGRMILYTCAMEHPETGRLVNTKQLRRFTDRKQVLSMIGRLLKLDCIVERWYAKAEHSGFSYDLRAVVQDGRMDFILARLSSGPITNLHLNNHPLKGDALGLPCHVMENVEQLCIRAAKCYPGLRSAGIDVLLEKGSLRPRIIELNGQGDLIYQDIYDKNRIYLHQAEMMKEWLYTERRINLPPSIK